MTASELQSLETHSDATVCSGLYTKATPMWSTKMHTSKLLKGVLISRTLNSSSSDQESSSASTNAPARGKRAFSSSDSSNALTSASKLVPKKASTSSSPVKTTCLCAPTKHAGSFRCRLHRVTQKHWDGRPIHLTTITSTSTSTAASSSSSLSPANENSDTFTPFVGPTAGCVSRTGAAARPSRLRMVVVAQAEETTDVPYVDDAASPMLSESSVKYIKVATSTTITQDVIANEKGASVSRKLHTSS